MVMVKGEQNHRKTIDPNGSRRKKIIVSHRSQKMTTVHLYIPSSPLQSVAEPERSVSQTHKVNLSLKEIGSGAALS